MQSKTIETVEQERSLLVTPHPRGAGCFIYSTDVGNSIILAPEHVRALIEALRPCSILSHAHNTILSVNIF